MLHPNSASADEGMASVPARFRLAATTIQSRKGSITNIAPCG
jgi:hypothetical protein